MKDEPLSKIFPKREAKIAAEIVAEIDVTEVQKNLAAKGFAVVFTRLFSILFSSLFLVAALGDLTIACWL